MVDGTFGHFLLFSIIPILLSVFLIAAALKPDLFIRESKRHMFIRFKLIWLLVGFVLLTGNIVRLVLILSG